MLPWKKIQGVKVEMICLVFYNNSLVMAPITVTKIRWEIFFLIRNLNECIKSDSAIDDAALSTPDDECLELLQKKTS